MTTPATVGAVDELPREKVEHFDREVQAILKRYPPDHKAAAMLPALRAGQEIFGYVSPAVQKLAADRLGVSPARAEEVATFYVMFHTEPIGRHLVEICTNVSCCLTGGDRLFEYLRRKLELANGATTRDGRITGSIAADFRSGGNRFRMVCSSRSKCSTLSRGSSSTAPTGGEFVM